MMVNTRPTGRAMSLPGGLAMGLGVSMFVTVAASLILTKLVLGERMQMQNIGYGILILLIAAAFLGAMVAQGRVKRRKLLVCVLSGVVYYGVLLGVTAMFFGGQYSGVGVTGLLILAGSGAAALLATGKGRGSKIGKSMRKRRGMSYLG